MIRICRICKKPIYSWDKAVSNDDERACHLDCFRILSARWFYNKPPFRTGSALNEAFYILITMEEETNAFNR